jgi:hypothetical protein
MIPDIDGKEQRPRFRPADPQQGLIIGIIDGELAEAQPQVRQAALQDSPDAELSQAGVGAAAVEADQMKHEHGVV